MLQCQAGNGQSQLHPLRKRFVHPSGLYQYHQGSVFYPGAESEVLEMRFSKPLNALLGTCVACSVGPPHPVAGRAQIYVNPAIVEAGIGGIPAVQPLRFQGLYDTANG